MTIKASKPSVNLREKLNELDQPQGLKGTELLRADTVAEARTAIGAGRKNLIINGAMQVAQRGTSQTTSGYGSLDRWLLALSGATGTMSQETFALGQTDVQGAEKFLKLAVTTGNNNCGVFYKAEAKDVIHTEGQIVTLSFSAKGTSPTNGLKIDVAWVAVGGTSSSTESLTLTGTWTDYGYTFTVPSLSGISLDASSYLQIKFMQDAGDTGTSAWELNLANVQLEVGSTATDFEHRSYGEELALCQRYYCKSQGGIGSTAMWSGYPGSTGTGYYAQAQYPTQMRATPTIVLTEAWNDRFTGPRAVQEIDTLGFRTYDLSDSTGGARFADHWTADAEL